jgi:hypothetical protein
MEDDDLRHVFAIAAMHATLPDASFRRAVYARSEDQDKALGRFAEDCYAIADAMLAASKQKP